MNIPITPAMTVTRCVSVDGGFAKKKRKHAENERKRRGYAPKTVHISELELWGLRNENKKTYFLFARPRHSHF